MRHFEKDDKRLETIYYRGVINTPTFDIKNIWNTTKQFITHNYSSITSDIRIARDFAKPYIFKIKLDPSIELIDMRPLETNYPEIFSDIIESELLLQTNLLWKMTNLVKTTEYILIDVTIEPLQYIPRKKSIIDLGQTQSP